VAICVAFVAIGHDRKLLFWALAFALYPVTFLIFGLRPVLPHGFTVLAGNTALMGMFVMYTEGLCRLHSIKFSRLAIWLPLPIGVLGLAFLLDDFDSRITWGAYLATYQSFVVIYILLKSLRNDHGRGRWIVFVAVMSACGLLLARNVLLASGFRASLNYMQPGLPQTLILSLSMMFLIMFALGLLVTYKERAEREMTRLALQDPLTQLGNRLVLHKRLSNAFVSSNSQGVYGALMMLDLDHFKELNDTHGHALGDQLLVDVAYRLKDCVSDTDTVVRLGGDEFVLLIENLNSDASKSKEEADTISQRVLDKITMPYRLQHNDDSSGTSKRVVYYLTVSIGIEMFKGEQLKREELLRHADAAMYQAKQLGRNRAQFYQSDTYASAQVRASVQFRHQALDSKT